MACSSREICSATLQGLLRVVKDQVEEGSVVVAVLSRESAMWREESMRTLLRNAIPEFWPIPHLAQYFTRCAALLTFHQSLVSPC